MEENQNLGYHGYPVTDAAAVASGGARDWQSLLQMPMTRTRIEFLHFLHIYNEWITKSQRDPKELQVLLVNNGLSPHCMHPSYWFNRIWDSEIYDQQVNDPQTLRAIRQRFAREEHKVYSILQSRDLNYFPYGKPSPNDRWRDAVWSIGMLFAEMYATLDATQKAQTDWQTSDDPERGPFVMPPVASIKPLEEAIANSPGAQRKMSQFVRRMDRQQRGLGQSHAGVKAVVQYGPMRSWFFNAKAKENPNLPHDLINLDLQVSLMVGDFVDGIFQHELEHQDKSNFYPDFLAKHQRLAKEAQNALDKLKKEGKGITITHQGVENFNAGSETEKLVKQMIRHNFLFSLLHPVWNCAEDNMCDQGVSNSGNPLRRKKSAAPYDMAHSSNMGTLIARGVGPRLIGIAPEAERVDLERHAQKNKVPQEQNSQEAAAAYEQLHKIQSAILFAFYIRNQLTEDTPEGWKALGIDISAVEDAAHPELSHEEAYMEMRKLCDLIAESQPLPRDQSQNNESKYRKLCVQACEQRNHYMDELFSRFVSKTVEKIVEDFEKKSLEKQLEQLRKQLDEAGKRSDEVKVKIKPKRQNKQPGEEKGTDKSEEEGEANGTEEEISVPTDSRINDKPGQHHDRKITEKEGSGARTWEDARSAGEQADIDAEEEEHRQRNQKDDAAGGDRAGLGGNPLAKVDFGDGRSLSELREDPKYQQAVEYVAERLRSIAERFPTMVLQHEERASLSPMEAAHMGDLAGRADKEALWNLAIAQQTGEVSLDTLRVFQDDVEVPFASPGDLMLNIDLSYSMSKGRGSRAEAAVKSAALLYDASRSASFGAYVNVWGNDYPSIVAAPGVDDAVVVGMFDRLVKLAVYDQEIKGLQNGTDFYGAFASQLAQLAIERHEDTLRPAADGEVRLAPRKMPRGPVMSIFLSDGEIGIAPKHDKSFNNVNGLTVDSCFTTGDPASMIGFIDKLPDAFGGSHVHVDISNPATIPEALVRWVETRYQGVLDSVQGNRHQWLSQETLESQMEETLYGFMSENNTCAAFKNKKPEDFIKNAQDQIEKLKNTPPPQIVGGTAQLSRLEPIPTQNASRQSA